MTRVINRGQDIVKQSKVKNLLRGNPAWRKGVSGNPNGRAPTAKCIPDILRRIGDQQPTESMLAKIRAKYGADCNPATMREAMLLSAYAEAVLGDVHARDFISERTEGRVAQVTANMNMNQDVDDLTKMPLANILQLAQELSNAG